MNPEDCGGFLCWSVAVCLVWSVLSLNRPVRAALSALLCSVVGRRLFYFCSLTLMAIVIFEPNNV